MLLLVSSLLFSLLLLVFCALLSFVVLCVVCVFVVWCVLCCACVCCCVILSVVVGGPCNLTWSFVSDWLYHPGRLEHYVWAYHAGHQDQVSFVALTQYEYHAHFYPVPDRVLHRGGQYIHHNQKNKDFINIMRIVHGAVIRQQGRSMIEYLTGQCSVPNYFQLKRLQRICRPEALTKQHHYQPIEAPTFINDTLELMQRFTPDFIPQTD